MLVPSMCRPPQLGVRVRNELCLVQYERMLCALGFLLRVSSAKQGVLGKVKRGLTRDLGIPVPPVYWVYENEASNANSSLTQ